MHFVICDSLLLIISATFNTWSRFFPSPPRPSFLYFAPCFRIFLRGRSNDECTRERERERERGERGTAGNRVLWFFVWDGCRGTLAEFMDGLFIVQRSRTVNSNLPNRTCCGGWNPGFIGERGRVNGRELRGEWRRNTVQKMERRVGKRKERKQERTRREERISESKRIILLPSYAWNRATFQSWIKLGEKN